MATTTNFGWETPDDTDLVKDGAAAMRTLGNAIDTSLVDLKGGTTGQVLAKASNTDMDFSWVVQDDSNAIQNAIVDAKGDLISATAADTPARLAVGTDGQVLTADSTAATGLKWATSSSGAYTLLASGTLSGASVVVSSLSTTYKDLRIIINNYKPATDNDKFMVRMNNDSTANRHRSLGSSMSNNGAPAETSIESSNGSDNSVVTYGIISLTIPDYANTTTAKILQGISMVNDYATTTNGYYYGINGWYNQTGAITGVTFLNQSGGNFTSGNYYIYGVK